MRADVITTAVWASTFASSATRYESKSNFLPAKVHLLLFLSGRWADASDQQFFSDDKVTRMLSCIKDRDIVTGMSSYRLISHRARVGRRDSDARMDDVSLFPLERGVSERQTGTRKPRSSSLYLNHCLVLMIECSLNCSLSARLKFNLVSRTRRSSMTISALPPKHIPRRPATYQRKSVQAQVGEGRAPEADS